MGSPFRKAYNWLAVVSCCMPDISWPPACTDWSKSQNLDPIGSAGYYEGFLLVEQPLPWPGDVSEMPELVEVAKVAHRARLRLQAVAQATRREADGPLRMVTCYWSTRPGWAGPMARCERLVEPASLVEAVQAMVEQAAPTPAAGAADAMADVLVCTHGRRDVCCGGRGMELLGTLAGAPTFGQPGVRLWRTSHTGGHRFAPTAIALPSATLWAWSDAALLSQVVGRRRPAGLGAVPLSGLRVPRVAGAAGS